MSADASHLVYLLVHFVTFWCTQKKGWQIPFTLHNIHSPVIVYDPKYLSQQLWTPLRTATTTFGIMMPDLEATAIEASTFWGDDIISSNNLTHFLPWAMVIDQVFLPVITLLGVLQLPHVSSKVMLSEICSSVEDWNPVLHLSLIICLQYYMPTFVCFLLHNSIFLALQQALKWMWFKRIGRFLLRDQVTYTENEICDAHLIPDSSSPADGNKHLLPLWASSGVVWMWKGWSALLESFVSSKKKQTVNKVVVQLGTREKNHGDHGNIAAIGTEELSKGRNKITAVTCTEWHEKHFGVTVIVLVVTKRDHYLQCSKWTTFRAAR